MTMRAEFKSPTAPVVCWIAVLFLLCGCSPDKNKLTEAEKERIALAQEVELVQAGGGLVLMVEGDALSSDEVLDAAIGGYGPQADTSLLESLKPLARNTSLDEFKKQARPYVEDILIGKISGILIYQHAKRETEDNAQINAVIDGLVEKEWREYVLRFGGDVAKADAELIAKGTDRKKFKENYRKSFTTQALIASKFPKDEPVTYRQLLDCYDHIKDDMFARRATIVFRLIDIDVLKLGIGESGESPLDRAKSLAVDLMKRIRAGEDFGELAKQYSHGYKKAAGGLWDPVSPDSLARPYDQVAKATETIEVGQIAGPIDAVGRIFIVKLEERNPAGYEPFEQVQRTVDRVLRAERENAIMRDIGMKYMDRASEGKTDEFMNFCMEEIYKRSNE